VISRVGGVYGRNKEGGGKGGIMKGEMERNKVEGIVRIGIIRGEKWGM
jgi:hypothetical protein